jgi:hypothetical protein
MKVRKLCALMATCVIAIGLQPQAGWATRVVGAVTGEVTATPSQGQIEVAHRIYHIKPNSPAGKELQSVHTGQVVDLIFEAASGSEAEVVSISPHTGS